MQQQLIVLNPFLDSLGHSGLKNLGLPPGEGSGFFQSSQDIVKMFFICFRSEDGIFYLLYDTYFSDCCGISRNLRRKNPKKV